MLYRLRGQNQRWRTYVPLLVNENRWRAQRYGIDKGLVDFGRGEIVDYDALIEEVIELVREDAEFFGCVKEVEHARTIIKNGTSSHWQLKTYQMAMSDGANPREALEKVVDMLVAETQNRIDD